jgi:hypothetical protein
LVMDCTTTGAPPPIVIEPTRTPTLFRLGGKPFCDIVIIGMRFV